MKNRFKPTYEVTEEALASSLDIVNYNEASLFSFSFKNTSSIEEALDIDLLRLELALNKEDTITTKAIKEVINYTSFDKEVNIFLEASLEEASLEALKDTSFKYFKASKPLLYSNKYLASYLLVNNEEVLEAINILGTKKHLKYIEEAKTSLYCFFVPKTYLRDLNCSYLMYKNDLKLNIKPSKVTFINNRFNEEKALALTSLLFDNICNIFIVNEKDLNNFLNIVPIEASSLDRKNKVKAFSMKFKNISDKLIEAKASSSFDNKVIKEVLTSKEASLYYSILKRRSLFNFWEKEYIKNINKRSFNTEALALEEALASKDYLEAKAILKEASFYNIASLIEVLEEALASFNSNKLLLKEVKAKASIFEAIEEAYLNNEASLEEVLEKEEALEKAIEEASLEEVLEEASLEEVLEEASLEEAFLEEALEEASYLEEALEEEDNSFKTSSSLFNYLNQDNVTSFKYKEVKTSEVKTSEAKTSEAKTSIKIINNNGSITKEALIINTNKYLASEVKALALEVKALASEVKALEEAKTKAKTSLKEAKASSNKKAIIKAKGILNKYAVQLRINKASLEKAKTSLEEAKAKTSEAKTSEAKTSEAKTSEAKTINKNNYYQFLIASSMVKKEEAFSFLDKHIKKEALALAYNKLFVKPIFLKLLY